MPKKINILLTSVGRRVELLRAFRDAYQQLGITGSIIAVDCDRMAPGLQVADRHFVVPPLGSPGYVPALEEILRREGVSVVFPLIDPDIPVLARNRELLEATGAKLAVFTQAAADIAADKWQTADIFRSCGLATPRSWLPGELAGANPEYPLFIKPRTGSAGEYTFKVENDRQLAFFVDYVPNPIIQEFLSGAEITTDMVCDLEGEVLSLVSRQRIRVRGGEVSVGRTGWDDRIAGACLRVAHALNACGPFTIQCIMHNGIPVFTEVNPRFGGGVPAGIAAGANGLLLLLSRIAGVPIAIPPLGSYRRNRGFARYDVCSFFEVAEDSILGVAVRNDASGVGRPLSIADAARLSANANETAGAVARDIAKSSGARQRIHLSPPHMSPKSRELLLDAFDSNWIAPLGPHVDALEREFAEKIGVKHAVALSSGTAALHLALQVLGVGAGDEVATATLTFAATANAIRYVGGTPVFIDSQRSTWNLDPDLLALEFEAGVKRGRPLKAVVAVDVCGQCADYEPIRELCRFYETPLIEDAAEALGATYRGRTAGTFGDIACFSFNGNKIITTSGGGMLVTQCKEWADKARYLASQARDPFPHYEHSEVGYNYRLSNLLAAVGRAQLEVLDDFVDIRRANFRFYEQALANLPGISFMPEHSLGRSTRWLTCITVDPDQFGATREDIRLALEQQNIESRAVWKPMHLQPAYLACHVQGGEVAEELFQRGLCLPSGSNLSQTDLTRIVDVIRDVHKPASSALPLLESVQ